MQQYFLFLIFALLQVTRNDQRPWARRAWEKDIKSSVELPSTQDFSTPQGRTDQQDTNRRLNQAQSTRHMSSRLDINSDLCFMGRWELLVELRVRFQKQGWGSKAELFVLCVMFENYWGLTRYHCWFHMGSSNSLSAGQSLHSLRDALLLRRFSYCCSAHKTYTQSQAMTIGLFCALKREETILHASEGANNWTPPLTRSSSDSCLVVCSALRFILRGWLRCLNKKWSSRAPICREEDRLRKWHNTSHLLAEACCAGQETSLSLAKGTGIQFWMEQQRRQFHHSDSK